MGSLNRVLLVGRLGRDAELKYTPGGIAVLKFSVATTEQWNDRQSGQRQERTEWTNIVVWGKAAEPIAEYLTKGKEVCIEGKLQTDEWTDKDGNKRKTTNVRADRVILMGGSGRTSAPDREPVAATAAGRTNDRSSSPADEDDIPF